MTDPINPKKPKPARTTRFVAAGAAVGATLALAGGMAAVSADSASPPAPATRQVVVTQPSVPNQIVIVLPAQGDGLAATTTVDVLDVISSIEIPAPPDPPSTSIQSIDRAPAPITESGGS